MPTHAPTARGTRQSHARRQASLGLPSLPLGGTMQGVTHAADAHLELPRQRPGGAALLPQGHQLGDLMRREVRAPPAPTLPTLDGRLSIRGMRPGRCRLKL